MVSNALNTIDEITYETLRILKNKLGLGNRCIRSLDREFAQKGAKIGDTLRVRLPPRYVSTNGPAFNQQAVTETYKLIQVSNQTQIGVSFGSAEFSLAMDNLAQNVLQPVAVQIASDIDLKGTQTIANGYAVTNSGYFSANYAGQYAGFFNLATPGGLPGVLGPVAWTGNVVGQGATSIQTAAQPFFQAVARMDEQSTPEGDRFCVLSPAAMASTVPWLFTNFNPSEEIAQLYRTGLMGELAGLLFYKSQNIPTFTTGTRSGAANASVVTYSANNGDVTISINVASGQTVVAGDQFTIAGVNSINPINRLSTGLLQVFTLTTGATANATNVAPGLGVYPPLNFNSNAAQSAYNTISALPTAGSNVNWMGPASTATQVNFAYHREALALAIAPLRTDLSGADVSYAGGEDGDDFMLRYVKQYTYLSDQQGERFDVLYGWAVVRPELGCRIQG